MFPRAVSLSGPQKQRNKKSFLALAFLSPTPKFSTYVCANTEAAAARGIPPLLHARTAHALYTLKYQ